jgi:prefoldin alpha subunit
MSQKEQKNKVIEFQILNQKVQQLQEQLQNINNNIQELQILKNSLEELGNIKYQEILIPLGQGIFAKGSIKNSNELITNVGSNIMIEKDLSETKDMVKVNILNLSKILERNEEEIYKNIEKLQELQKEIIEKEKQ